MPVEAMPWMNARCSKKNSRIIGIVPSTATAINWSRRAYKAAHEQGNAKRQRAQRILGDDDERPDVHVPDASRKVNTASATRAGLQSGSTIIQKIRIYKDRNRTK